MCRGETISCEEPLVEEPFRFHVTAGAQEIFKMNGARPRNLQNEWGTPRNETIETNVRKINLTEDGTAYLMSSPPRLIGNAFIVAMMHKKFSIAGLREASVTTAKASAMVLWIMFGASVFVGFYILQGGQQFVTDAILGTGMSAYGILLLLMVLLVVLGMFLDWVGILLLAVPIFIPIVKALEFPGLFGFPPVAGDDVVLWFGVLYLVNMQQHQDRELLARELGSTLNEDG